LPVLFIIAGCNGAGKTTASYTILPELLNIKEFVNADEIARGLSPFQPEKLAIEAGRIMLGRIRSLISQRTDFAFETTLASRSFVALIDEAKQAGYKVNLLYYWLDDVDLAIERVRVRVSEGGHNIARDVIVRRYYSGLKNLLTLYIYKVDFWLLVDNSKKEPEVIAEGNRQNNTVIYNNDKFSLIKRLIEDDK
jgi:predicted ABC-type ATPase